MTRRVNPAAKGGGKHRASTPPINQGGNKMKPMPDKCIEDHLIFLDELRDSGSTNMFGATPYLKDEFPDLSKNDARAILGYWMDTFSERHKK